MSNPSINHSAWTFVPNHCSFSKSSFSLSRREVRWPFVSDYQTSIILALGVNELHPMIWSCALSLSLAQLKRLTQLCSYPFSSPCFSSYQHFWAVLDHSFTIMKQHAHARTFSAI